MNHVPEQPILPFNQGSLHAIDSAIVGYLAILKQKRRVPSDTIQKFHSFRLKLAPHLLRGGFPDGTILPLSPEERRLIEAALRGFVDGIQAHFASSPQQQAVIQELEALRRYLHTSGTQETP